MIVALLIIAAFAALILIGRAKAKNTPVAADHHSMLTLTDTNFQNQLKDKVVLVDFWASWCMPCKIMAPVLNEVSSELNGNAFVGKIDVEQYQFLAGKYRVQSIPTMILFRNGREVSRFVGVKSKDFLLKQINNTR
jgi:thioredoxin 1